MTKPEIFEILKQNIQYFLPDISEELITIEESLKNLGANSIDRMEIITKTMEDLQVKFPLVELGKLTNIEGLIDFLYEKVSSNLR